MNGDLLEVVFSTFEVLLIQHIVAFTFIENILMHCVCVPPFNLLLKCSLLGVKKILKS